MRSEKLGVIRLMGPALTLAVTIFLAYMNSVSCPFFFDDQGSVINNRYIHKLWPLSDVLFKAIPDSPPAGRPVVSLSFAINYALGGLDVRGYHLFNIAVHLASTLVLWGVLRQTMLNTRLNVRFGKAAPFLAFAVTLIWAIHPLLTESVTYISQRTELLMGLFYLLTLYGAILAWQSLACDRLHEVIRAPSASERVANEQQNPVASALGSEKNPVACAPGSEKDNTPNSPQRSLRRSFERSRFWSVVAVISCAIGMGCKETMVSAPLMVLLYDVILVSSSLRDALRRHWKLYIGLAATWGLLAWFNLSGPRIQTCGWDLGIGPLDYLRTQAAIIVWYLRLCFWPHPLVISYEGWPLATSFTAILPQGLLIVVLLVLTAWALWRRHPVALLGAWFFMILAPTSSFIPIVTEIAAERRMYLPLAAVIVAVVVGIYELIRLVNRRLTISFRGATVVAPVMLVLIAAAFGVTTFMRNRDYQSAISIWKDAVAKRPDNPQALCNLGIAMTNTGEHEQAIRYCTRAIELRPNQPIIYETRGTAYAAMNNFSEAIQDFNRAIELQPDLRTAYNRRGSAYGKTGDHPKAIEDYNQAINLQPDYAEAYYNRGIAYGRMRDYTRAIQDFSRAIELKIDYADAYYNRGVAYGSVHDYDRAIQDYTKMIELKPDHVNARNNRGNAYLSLGDHAQAIKDHSEAIELKPDYAAVYGNRANAYRTAGQYDKARADIEKCKQLGGQVNPMLIEALNKVSSRPG